MTDCFTRLGADLMDAHGRLYPSPRPTRRFRRTRRRVRAHPLLATGLIALGIGAPLAAADALGAIELGGGATASPVSSLPEWNGKTGTFVTGGHGTPYIYHITGGAANSLSCGPADPNPVNNLYITSTRPLAPTELKEILTEEVGHDTIPAQTLAKATSEGKLPPGVSETTTGRHPVVSGSGTATPRKLPPGVISTSNGCPTPGVAGQPGSPGSPAAPGNAGVTVAPSQTGATP